MQEGDSPFHSPPDTQELARGDGMSPWAIHADGRRGDATPEKAVERADMSLAAVTMLGRSVMSPLGACARADAAGSNVGAKAALYHHHDDPHPFPCSPSLTPTIALPLTPTPPPSISLGMSLSLGLIISACEAWPWPLKQCE